MRKFIYEMIESAETSSRKVVSYIYDFLMIATIVVSLIPLAFKDTNQAFEIIEIVCVVIFSIDYLLRWITADYKLSTKKKFVAFLVYPITFMALIDIISILPSLTNLNEGLRVLRVFRLIRAIRVFRVFKAFRYSNNIRILANVLNKSRHSLGAVGTLAIGYIVISALVIFTVEPESFENFFDAVYWATVSLTTVGYGDIYPVTVAGRIVTMISSAFGIAIIALPSGIITAGYMKELNGKDEEKKENETSNSSNDDGQNGNQPTNE